MSINENDLAEEIRATASGKVSIRQGIVQVVNVDGTVTVDIAKAGPPYPTARCLAWIPQAGETVMIFQSGGDIMVQGLGGNFPGTHTGDVKWGVYASAPPGWVKGDGASYPTGGIYAALFAQTGYTYGGSGGNFNVPDLRGRFAIGAGAGVGLTSRTLGATGGEEKHILSEAELANHMHNVHSTGSTNTTHNHAGVGGLSEVASPNAANNTIVTSDGAGSNAGHNTIPPFVALTPVIKL